MHININSVHKKLFYCFVINVVFYNAIVISIIAEKDCGAIQVSAGSDTRSPNDDLHGLYSLSEDKSAPNNHVWKLNDGNSYIFNSGGSKKFIIGKEEHKKTGGYYYQSKKYKFYFTLNDKIS